MKTVLQFIVGGALGLALGIGLSVGMLMGGFYVYDNTWWTTEGFYPMTLTADEAGRCHEEPDRYDPEDGSLLEASTEMCDRVTIFRDGSGTVRAITKVETSSVTDNTYRSEWKVVATLEGCEPGDYCLRRSDKEVSYYINQLAVLRGETNRGEGTDF